MDFGSWGREGGGRGGGGGGGVQGRINKGGYSDAPNMIYHAIHAGLSMEEA